MVPRSNSQQAEVGPALRAAYLFRLALMHLRRLRQPADFSHIRQDLATYFDVYHRATGRQLADARVLEVGFGQRPFRLIALQSLGVSAVGIDLDAPLYQLDLRTVLATARRNGVVRAAKSLLRRILFDGHEYRGLRAFLRESHGSELRFNTADLIVGDAGDAATWVRAKGPFDFVYSEDVFEHVPVPDLEKLLDHLADNLTDAGVAVVTPNIFTGICGGHDLGWYPYQVNMQDVSRGPAWGHLTGESPIADTFLNRLSRAELRNLLNKRFVIESETPILGDLGRQHLTAERRAALSDYSDEELFSNSVRFVLRKKPRPV